MNGLTTAANYALSGLVDLPVAAECIVGGFIGRWIRIRVACRLDSRKTMLNRLFASLVCMVAVYILYRNLMGLLFI